MSPGEQLIKVMSQLVDQAVSKRVLEELSGLRARMIQVQEAALTAASLPTAEGVAKLDRRVRSARDGVAALDERVTDLEARLGSAQDVRAELAELRATVAELTARLDARG